MAEFDFEKFDVYNVGMRVVCLAAEAVKRIPSEYRVLADQLLRAASSIILNIAEGAGEFSPGDKVRLYRYARRSAWETAAAFGILGSIGVLPQPVVTEGKALIARTAAMMTNLIDSVESRNLSPA